MNSLKPAILLKLTRGSLVEREHYGYIAIVDENENLISQIGQSCGSSFFLRSCAKPFQALPIIKSGAFKTFGMSLKQLSVCCSSHVGTSEHTKIVKEILQKIGLNETHLKCGVHSPIDEKSNNDLVRQNIEPSSVHNNCSGKHAGMLAVCVHNKWEISTYLDFEHPLQKEILTVTKNFCNLKEEVYSTLDGCMTPIYGMPLCKMGAGFFKLLSSKEGDLIRQAFAQNPLLIGGTQRIDSEVIKASKGRLFVKVGAEGLCVVVNFDTKQTLVVKVMDANIYARSLIVVECLKQLNWLNAVELSQLEKIYDKKIKTLNGTIVGDLKSDFLLGC